MNIPDEALKRFPPSMAIDNLDGTDYFVDDEWGYDDLQRKAFIAGAEWARKEVLREAAEMVELFDRGSRTEHFKVLDVQARHIAKAIRELAEWDTDA